MKVVCILTAAALLMVTPILLWSAEETGAAIYDSNCAMCHGAKGEGNTDMQMPAAAGTAMTAEQLVTYLLKGDKAKTVHADPVADLDEAKAKAVAEFTKTLKK